MQNFGQSFVTQVLHVGWNVSRYFLASATVMFATMSVVTGQFPPPLFEIYKSVKELRSNMNVAKSASLMAQHKNETEKLLKEINSADRSPASASVDLSDPNAAPAANSELRIKNLEYEVALLKSKLYRAEWEAEQLREQATAAKK